MCCWVLQVKGRHSCVDSKASIFNPLQHVEETTSYDSICFYVGEHGISYPGAVTQLVIKMTNVVKIIKENYMHGTFMILCWENPRLVNIE